MISSLVLQLLVVVSPNWNAVDGVLYRFERSHDAQGWEMVGWPIAVTLGKQGMVPASSKQEGDGRSPAGLFGLGPVFGDVSHQTYARHMPFLLITDDLECVDDPESSHYNQFVTKAVMPRDWKSSEKMSEVGTQYALGVVVQHNTAPVQAGRGSAIFMHIWKGPGAGTAGCTAMSEGDLAQVVSWLDSKKHPSLLQLPAEEYNLQRSQWGLPEIPSRVGST